MKEEYPFDLPQDVQDTRKALKVIQRRIYIFLALMSIFIVPIGVVSLLEQYPLSISIALTGAFLFAVYYLIHYMAKKLVSSLVRNLQENNIELENVCLEVIDRASIMRTCIIDNSTFRIDWKFKLKYEYKR